MENTVTVEIKDLARAGSGVAKLDTGAVLFTPYTLPGDVIEAKIVKSEKNYSNGELVKIITPSPDRVEAPCPVFQTCGGCSWQHVPYSLQFETKKKGLLFSLKRAGIESDSIPVDEMPAKNQYNYRNRIQLRGDSTKKIIGFYERNSTRIVPIQNCLIADPRINEALPGLAQKGFAQSSGDFKLEIDVTPDGTIHTAWNEKHASLGFKQVNDEQNEVLQSWIKKHLKPADLLFDLFGGHGNLSLPVAENYREAYCVDTSTPTQGEVSPPANYRFETKSILAWAKTPHPRNNLSRKSSLILDPPREGLGSIFPQIEGKISKLKVESLILVGCDVDSFVKDVRNFIKAGYRLERLGVLDLFPQTPHIESLALFSK